MIEPGGFDCADVFGNTAAVSVEGKSFFIDKYGKKFMVTDKLPSFTPFQTETIDWVSAMDT